MALNLDTVDAATLHVLATLRDDTEEDLVGADLHQDAITDIHIGLATYAQEQGLPWYVTKQVLLIAMLGRQEWRPSPDVYVVPGVSAHPRTSYDTRVEPFPPFIVRWPAPRRWTVTWTSSAGSTSCSARVNTSSSIRRANRMAPQYAPGIVAPRARLRAQR